MKSRAGARLTGEGSTARRPYFVPDELVGLVPFQSSPFSWVWMKGSAWKGELESWCSSVPSALVWLSSHGRVSMASESGEDGEARPRSRLFCTSVRYVCPLAKPGDLEWGHCWKRTLGGPERRVQGDALYEDNISAEMTLLVEALQAHSKC